MSLSCFVTGETLFFNGVDGKKGYYLVPDSLGKAEKVWVVVDVHGAGGGGTSAKESFITKLLVPQKVIVIVPSFTNGYQGGDGKWAAQLISNFTEVRKRYSTYAKMFIHGQSGGGQFAHRFAFNYSEYVIGVSAHSAGSWACAGGYGKISNKAKSIPFVISCGEEDKEVAWHGYSINRIDWFHRFANKLKAEGFVLMAKTWPNTGHSIRLEDYGSLLKSCFILSTQGVARAEDSWSGDLNQIPVVRSATK